MRLGYSCQIIRPDGSFYPKTDDFIGGLFLFSVLRRWKSSREPDKKAVTRFLKRTSKRFDEFERFKKNYSGLIGRSLNEIEHEFQIRIFIWTKGNKKSAPKCLIRSLQNNDWSDLNFLSERHEADYLQ